MIIRSMIIRKIALLHKKISTDVFLQIIIIINSSGGILRNAVTSPETLLNGYSVKTGLYYSGRLYAQLDQPPKVLFEINALDFLVFCKFK